MPSQLIWTWWDLLRRISSGHLSDNNVHSTHCWYKTELEKWWINMPYSSLALLILCTQGVWGIGALDSAPIVTVKENQCYNWSKPGGEKDACCTVLVVLDYPLVFYPGCNICSPLFSLSSSSSGKHHLGLMWSLALWFQSMSVCWTASWDVSFPRDRKSVV